MPDPHGREETNRQRSSVALKKLHQLLQAAVHSSFNGRIAVEVYSRNGTLNKVQATCMDVDTPEN